ncbi:MAG: glycosyltransferase family 2 protein [Syntrophaceae bacterium]|nr:glycosyltransferase family 2 protein [Syntrophaceae bacterium]
MKLSVVTTLFYSSSFILEFYNRIINSIKKITDEYEIIFVNDGSPDNSLANAIKLVDLDNNIKVIDLSRNFGHHKAMMTGLFHTVGDFVFMIDSDLEEMPELLNIYWNEMISNPNADVVYGILRDRQGGIFKRATGSMFYSILNYLSAEDMPKNISFSRLMTKQYVKCLTEHKEREMYIGGLWHIVGFNQISVMIDKSFKGVSSYTLQKKISMMVNAVTSFSNKPLIFIFNTGFFIFFLSLCFGLYFLARKYFFGAVLSGWTSLILSLWLLSGLIILCLGIIAIYLSKIFIETKNRPYSIIKEIYSKRNS